MKTLAWWPADYWRMSLGENVSWAESSAIRVIITQFALDEVISLVPSHPPPYVMFSSLLTMQLQAIWHPALPPLCGSALPEDVFQIQWCTGAVTLIFYWCRDAPANSWNLGNVNEFNAGQKRRIKSPSQIWLSDIFFICAITKSVIPWSYSSRLMWFPPFQL